MTKAALPEAPPTGVGPNAYTLQDSIKPATKYSGFSCEFEVADLFI